MTVALFRIGRITRHRTADGRGIVVDSGPAVMGSKDGYDRITRSKPPKNNLRYYINDRTG